MAKSGDYPPMAWRDFGPRASSQGDFAVSPQCWTPPATVGGTSSPKPPPRASSPAFTSESPASSSACSSWSSATAAGQCPRRPRLRSLIGTANGRCAVVPRLMTCKTVQDAPPVAHSVVQESSSSSQGGSALGGATRREMEANGSIVGTKAADSNELERLFTQHHLHDASIVS